MTALGFTPAVAVLGDARRLLEDLPALGTAAGDDLRDASLSDDRIAVPSQAGIHEQLIDILETHRSAAQTVLALTRTVEFASDGDLIAVHRQQTVRVVQHQIDHGTALGFALGSTAEDHIFHTAAPEGLGGLFSEHPAHGVHNIALAAAVGAYHSGDPLVKGELHLVGKGLEALDLQRFDLQNTLTPLGSAAVCPQSALLRRFGTDSRPFFIPTPAGSVPPGSLYLPGW